MYLHTHPFNGSLSGTTQVSQYQKGNTNLDLTEARDSEWQWHQLGHKIKTKKTKAIFGHLLRPLVWKRNGPALKEVD